MIVRVPCSSNRQDRDRSRQLSLIVAAPPRDRTRCTLRIDCSSSASFLGMAIETLVRRSAMAASAGFDRETLSASVPDRAELRAKAPSKRAGSAITKRSLLDNCEARSPGNGSPMSTADLRIYQSGVAL